MEFDEVAARLDALAVHLNSPAFRSALAVPAAHAFGVGAGGELAALATALRTQCATALAAREREAGTLAAAVDGLAGRLRTAAASYRDAGHLGDA